MKSSFRNTLGPTLLALGAVLALGCQDHFSTQEAYAVCEDLADPNTSNGAASFDDCVACYETCGGDCMQAGTSPETFVCPDELGEGGGTGDGGGDGG